MAFDTFMLHLLTFDGLIKIDLNRHFQLIYGKHKFAKKRFDREFRWEPSAELEAAIFQAIFG